MRCERCIERGFAYCFMYPHSTPVVKIEARTETIEVRTYEFKGVRL